MPNYSIGSVAITGTQEAVTAFCDRFISTDKVSVPTDGRKHFYRSQSDMPRKELKKLIDTCFIAARDGEVMCFEFYASFAWSIESCLLENKKKLHPDDCICIGDACKEDHVQVEIHTAEPANDLEEWLICKENGVPLYGCSKLNTYSCKNCGNTQSLPSFEDPSDAVCNECGHMGFELCDPAEGGM